jgi:hypothetical protein
LWTLLMTALEYSRWKNIFKTLFTYGVNILYINSCLSQVWWLVLPPPFRRAWPHHEERTEAEERDAVKIMWRRSHETWGSHYDAYEDRRLLGCDAV